MEDAAVEFLLDNLQQLQLHKSHLISDVKNQIQVLESNLRLFKRFLNDSKRKRDKDKILKEVVGQIIRVVYEAEDAVEVFVSQATDKGLEKYFKRAFDAPAKLLSTIIQQVELIGAKVKEIYDQKKIYFEEFDTRERQENFEEEIKVPTVREDYVIGFEYESEQLIDILTQETQQLDVISVIGMAGIGKTTLAQKIFHDARIKSEFPIRLWVDVSSNFRKKDVYLTMLRDLSWMTEDMYDKTEAEIAQILHTRLDRDKFLIILDDMWNTQVWDDLQDIFAKHNNRMSKILITSRMLEVAMYANPNREPHKLRFRDDSESWELLLLGVFGEHECPPELASVGKYIARQCVGVPLLIKLIGGILAKKASESEVRERWMEVAETLQASVYSKIDMENVVSFCYSMLPDYLRPCFLYLGMFPEDFDIPVQRLILLWVAQGFIQQKTLGISLEETGEEYFKDLIDRNLVMINKVSRTGRIKTCRVHDLIRDFCISEAQKYFFHEIQGSLISSSNSDADQYLHKYRHISIHSQVVNFLSSQPYGPHVRTLLHFLREETILLPENVASIPDAFKLLRVLDVKPIRFTRFPFYLTQLVHLRYICLSSDFKVIPEAISKMWNIQTLIVDTTSRVLEIKADIWKMIHLRHLETNASIVLRKSTMVEGDHNNQGEKIQTLANISPQSCAQVFERANNLKKLGIRGHLATLITGEDDNSNGGSSSSTPFDGLRKLGHLEKLKLLNDVGASKLSGLPPPYKFPPKLMSLTLSYTFLDWKYMSILELLENLKVLKLKNNAFMGESWEIAENGFPQLEVLQVEYTNLVVWKASSSTHFPKLQYIALRNCEQLEALPFNLADVSTLKQIYLYRTTKSAIASAKKIQGLIEGREIELSIFPLEYE